MFSDQEPQHRRATFLAGARDSPIGLLDTVGGSPFGRWSNDDIIDVSLTAEPHADPFRPERSHGGRAFPEGKHMIRSLALIAAGLVIALPARATDDLLPPSIHQLEFEQHRLTPPAADLVRDRGMPIVALQERTVGQRPCATIFGYLPYWCSSSNCTMTVDAPGVLFGRGQQQRLARQRPRLAWTSVINQAHSNGVKVILVATLFDRAISNLITQPDLQEQLLCQHQGQDAGGRRRRAEHRLEGSGSWIAYVNGFMADLTAYLHAQLPGSEVTFAGPAVNWSDDWTLGLADSCDGIFIMGYAFWGSWSSTSGPTRRSPAARTTSPTRS